MGIMATGVEEARPSIHDKHTLRAAAKFDTTSEAGRIRHETREKLQKRRIDIRSIALAFASSVDKPVKIESSNARLAPPYGDDPRGSLMCSMLSMDGINMPKSARTKEKEDAKKLSKQRLRTMQETLEIG